MKKPGENDLPGLLSDCLMAAPPYQAYGSGYSGSGFCRPDKRSAIRQLNQRFTFSCSVSCGKTEWWPNASSTVSALKGNTP